jgi:hypothetical protein
MRRTVALLVVILTLVIALPTAPAFAHGGHSHRLMGTIKSLDHDTLVVTATDGHEVAVTLTAKTRYEKDGKAAERSALAVGTRVSIQLAEDEKTAVTIKIGAAQPAH